MAPFAAVTKERDRLCKLLGWEPSSSHRFEIVRATMNGQAIALGVDKARDLANRIEAIQEALQELNEATNPLLDVNPMVLHRARVKAQKLIGQCGEPE